MNERLKPSNPFNAIVYARIKCSKLQTLMTTCWHLVATFVKQLPAGRQIWRISRIDILHEMHRESLCVCVKQMRHRGGNLPLVLGLRVGRRGCVSSRWQSRD